MVWHLKQNYYRVNTRDFKKRMYFGCIQQFSMRCFINNKIRMNKYFKNDKKLTIASLLKTYENYNWGCYPELNSKKAEAERLMRECQETDEYKNWQAECDKVKAQRQEAMSQLRQVEGCKTEILLKNSAEQYEAVHKELQKKYRELDYKLYGLTKNPPKSKWDHFAVIEKSIKKGEEQARTEQDNWLKQQRAKCRCSGHYCEC